MRTTIIHEEIEPLEISEDALNRLKEWINTELDLAFSARTSQERLWREMLRLYEGVPKQEVRNTPIENAPNVEITLGAIAADAIYARAIDLIYSISPMVTVRATSGKFKDHTKALQRWVNFVAANESGIREASEHTILDDVQLGTGIYYIPWVKTIKKTKVAKVLREGPKVFTMPIEDFITAGGADFDLQEMDWCSLRFWYTETQLQELAKKQDLDIENTIPVGVVGWVKSKRENLGRTNSNSKIGNLYEIHNFYAHFDIDGDGIAEDLLIVYDRSSKSILKLMYNEFDNRPFESMRYQTRAHLFNGIGVIEMIKPYQEETTEIHNYAMLNMLLANCRFWKAKTGTIPPGTKFWPNKIQEMDDVDDLQPEQMGEIYPSILQAQSVAIGLAERRVGSGEISSPRPSSIAGSRTPGITALSFLQQANKRFTPAFDSMRRATSGALMQCQYRYKEKLLADHPGVEDHIIDVMGLVDGKLVIEVLKNEKLEEGIQIELTASSASVNADADKQNAMLLVNVLSAYYEKTLLLIQIASNPQVPPAVQAVAKKIAEVSGEIIERTIRTFDQVRDPETFIIKADEELDKIPNLDQDGLAGLGDLVGQLSPPSPEGVAV